MPTADRLPGLPIDSESFEGDSQFRLLCEWAPVGMFMANTAGECLFVNRSLAATMATPLQELLGRKWLDKLHRVDRPRVIKQWADAAAMGQEFAAEFRLQRPDEEVIWVACRAQLCREEAGSPGHYVGTLQDITERRCAELAALERERWFRTIFEQAAIGVALIETSPGRFVRINQRYCDLVGYTREQMQSKSFAEITLPADLEEDLRQMRRLVRGEIAEFSMEKRYRCRDGSIVWVHLTVSPTWNAGDPPQFHIAVVEDITARKRAERELQESEERFRRLSEHAPIGIYFCDTDGACRYLNDQACQIIGRSVANSLEQGWAEGLVTEDRQRTVDLWRDCVKNQRLFETTCCFVHADGSTVCASTTAIPMFDHAGEVFGWVGTLLDVTQQRLANEALQASEEQYRELFNANTDALFFTSLEGSLVDVNPAACRMHGYTREEFLRLRPDEFIHADSHHNFANFIETCRQGKLFHCEAQDIRKDGSLIDVEVYGTRMQFRGSYHAFAIVRDISARKANQRQSQEQEVMLAHVSRLSTLGEMTAAIAHEVNQPLHSIANFARAIRNSVADGADINLDTLADWTDDIIAAADSAGNIIRRLRDFSRGSPPQRAPVELAEIVERSVNLIAFDVRAKRIDVRQQLPSTTTVVSADAVQIQQVIVNLLKNAVESLESHAGERRILIDVAGEGELAVVRVSDSGGGISSTIQDALFEPFATHKKDGLGLGLAISRTIVQAHGGDISVGESQLGGATLMFTLPLDPLQL